MVQFVETLRSSAREVRKLRSLAGASMLMAVGIAINSFTIVVNQFMKIGFSFLTVALTGFLYGPIMGGMCGAAGDIIKYLIRPEGGAYFIGFTFNAFLSGFLYGLILYKKPVTWKRVFAAKFTTMVVINLCLTPLWLSITMGKGILVYLTARIVKNLVMLPIETAMLYFLASRISKVMKHN